MLENMAIQRLLAVREKEIDYMEKWINGISTRAALMSGCVCVVHELSKLLALANSTHYAHTILLDSL